jgi:cold shock protein
MATGTVKFFNHDRGFGFIQPDEGGKDVFVHASAVERASLPPLREGQKLVYEVESEEEAKQLIEGDPFHDAGIFASYAMKPWNRVF